MNPAAGREFRVDWAEECGAARMGGAVGGNRNGGGGLGLGNSCCCFPHLRFGLVGLPHLRFGLVGLPHLRFGLVGLPSLTFRVGGASLTYVSGW